MDIAEKKRIILTISKKSLILIKEEAKKKKVKQSVVIRDLLKTYFQNETREKIEKNDYLVKTEKTQTSFWISEKYRKLMRQEIYVNEIDRIIFFEKLVQDNIAKN